MDTKTLLSSLWIFLVVNYIFCDVFTLMHSEDLQRILSGDLDGVELNQEFLLGFAIVMEIPMLMFLFSRLLKRKLNQILNIIFGIFLGFVQLWSLTVGEVTLHYWFFSIIEIAACISIVVIALRWKSELSLANATQNR